MKRSCKLFVAPEFKKKFKAKAASQGLTIIEYSRLIALKDIQNPYFKDIGESDKRKQKGDFIDLTI